MAYYYDKLQGSRGPTTRLGTKASGLEVTLASYQGAVVVDLYDVDGVVYLTVTPRPWQGKGTSKVLTQMPISGEKK